MVKIFKRKNLSVAEIANLGSRCAWKGCSATFPKGDMPKGWVFLITYWSKRPEPNILKIPHRNMARDGVLCPEHAHQLEFLLEELGREVDVPAAGSA